MNNGKTQNAGVATDSAQTSGSVLIERDEAIELVMYGETRTKDIKLGTRNGDLMWAFDRAFELLEKHTVYDVEKIQELFADRLQALAMMKPNNPHEARG